jgi:hypothetical protein
MALMRRQQSTAVKTIAVINMVFGTLCILCGGCGALFQVGMSVAATAPAAGGGPNPVGDLVRFMNRELPSYQAVEISHAVALLVLGLVCVVAGIGLLYLQGWARWVTVAYAVLIILVQLGYVAYELAFVIPATQRFQATQVHPGFAPPPGTQQGQAVGAVLGVLFAAFLTIIQAAASLIVMLLPSTGAAFAPRRRRRREEDEDEAEDEDDYGRRRRRRPRDEDDWDE